MPHGPSREDRLRGRLELAEAWAAGAQAAGSWQAAATLLKAAEAFDEKLAALEAEGDAAPLDVDAMFGQLRDALASMPAAMRERVVATLTGPRAVH